MPRRHLWTGANATGRLLFDLRCGLLVLRERNARRTSSLTNLLRCRRGIAAVIHPSSNPLYLAAVYVSFQRVREIRRRRTTRNCSSSIIEEISRITLSRAARREDCVSLADVNKTQRNVLSATDTHNYFWRWKPTSPPSTILLLSFRVCVLG